MLPKIENLVRRLQPWDRYMAPSILMRIPLPPAAVAAERSRQKDRLGRKEGEGELFTPIDGHSDRKRDEREKASFSLATQKCPVGCGVDTALDSVRSQTYDVSKALRFPWQKSTFLD